MRRDTVGQDVPPKEDDYSELGPLTDEINDLKARLKVAYQRRRTIWRRRVIEGDPKTELAKASGVNIMDVTLGIQDKYFKK
jgi:hypothetical protein